MLTVRGLYVHCCVCRYIIGLPLHQRNATAMSRQLMITAKKELGPALQGFELGNEVRGA